jgi:uncharacterized protein YuzE
VSKPNFNYDETSDTLYFSFFPGEQATGIELNDHILLRINKQERKAIGITIFDYSILAERTEVGQRSFPITGLSALPIEVQELVWEILLNPPVSDFLGLLAYTPSIATEITPITFLQPVAIM